MHRAKLPFSVFKRPTKKRTQFIYYVRFRDEAGAYTTAVSSTKRSRSEAVNWAYEEIRAGRHLTRSLAVPTFAEAAAGFWDYDSSAYIAGRLARGKSFSKTFAEIREGIVRNYLVPAFGPMKLSAITHGQVERFVLGLYRGGVLSPATVNRILVTAKVMFKAWQLDGKIATDPTARVQVLEERARTRRILSEVEARRFFEYRWADERLRLVNLLAASTGLRLGECLGLQREDLRREEIAEGGAAGSDGPRRSSTIELSHNWQEREGLKGPKWDSYGTVPVPEAIGEALERLIAANPFGNSFVFYGDTAALPLSKKKVDASFRAVIHSIGIAEKERLERGLSFHAWRHWFNATMRRRVSDSQLRRVTRHRSAEMTERYDHLLNADLAAVRGVQEELFSVGADHGETSVHISVLPFLKEAG